MHLGHFHATDRKILYSLGWLSVSLTIGLTATGLWQFFYHEPTTALSGYVVGLGNPPSFGESTGVAALHGFLGDVAATLALFGGSWFSARVIYRVSWFGVASFLVLVMALITGSAIRFNASVHNGEVDVTTRGYAQFVSGDAALAITDRFELGLVWMRTWTLVHVVSIPILVLSAWFTLHQAQRRRAKRKADGPAWRKVRRSVELTDRDEGYR